jgi:hypothetical protein
VNRLLPLAFALALALSGPAPAADDEADPDAVPALGRPEGVPFSGASGRFKFEVAVEPAELREEEPLTLYLTVLIDPQVRVRQPPQRLDLAEVDGFRGRFLFAAPGDKDTRELKSDDKLRGWQFVYHLASDPKAVPPPREVPSVPFAYYDPEIRAAQERLRFQVIYSDPVPLTVRPRAVLDVPLSGPAFAFRAAPPAAVLTPDRSGLPSGWAVGAALLAPPLLCLAWLAAWRRLRPDSARLAQARRSRAARDALRALSAARRQPPPRQAELSAAALAAYLAERFGLAAREPTPDEAAAFLARAGCEPALAEAARDFFRACDAGRFGRAAAAGLAERGEALILTAEGRPCSPSPS